MIYSLKIKITINDHLPKNFHINFNSITIIVLKVDYKLRHSKKIVEKISLLERSVIPKSTSFLLPSSQTK